ALEFDRVLGLGLGKRHAAAIPAQIRKLVRERESFRKAKRWQEADKIRSQINKLGFTVEDTPRGPHLKQQ
ncbi:MAG: cysteine--tRNA ligase, partial [Patescibacteria group bacterium]